MSEKPTDPMPGATEEEQGEHTLNRRNFLTAVGLSVAGMLAGCSGEVREAIFQKHFLELSPDEVERRLGRIRNDCDQRFGREVSISALPAQPGVLFGYALDLSRCIGCRNSS